MFLIGSFQVGCVPAAWVLEKEAAKRAKDRRVRGYLYRCFGVFEHFLVVTRHIVSLRHIMAV